MSMTDSEQVTLGEIHRVVLSIQSDVKAQGIKMHENTTKIAVLEATQGRVSLAAILSVIVAACALASLLWHISGGTK